MNEIYRAAFGAPIAKQQLSTYWMYAALKAYENFEIVKDPEPGDIIISPTG